MRVLLLSSFCAASHVGSVASSFVLRRLGVDVCVLPTTLFGRHPGWGTPGGGVTSGDQLRGMWQGVHAQVKEQGLFFDAVMTGYMGSVDHVALAAEIIDTLSPAHVLVDPVMGDWSRDGDAENNENQSAGGLYIPQERAEAICDQLIPRAQIVTPNVWEWRYITGSLSEPRHAPPRPLAGMRETVVTSVQGQAHDDRDSIGAIVFTDETEHRVMHAKFDDMPNGGGDALAADYLARRLMGLSPGEALQRSVGEVFALMQTADATDAGELPLVRSQGVFEKSEPLTLVTKAID